MTGDTRCNYVNSFGSGKCPRSVHANGLCIFHMAKPTSEEKQKMPPDQRQVAELTEKRFREKFISLLEEVENDTQVDGYDFQGFKFPSLDCREKTFSKPIQFVDATFSGKADFSQATFSGKASFAGATFSGEAFFVGATFSHEANFSTAIFKGATLFKPLNHLVFDSEHECYFKRLRVDKEASVEFEGVILSKASFLDTNLEILSFRNVRWHPLTANSYSWRNVALWDEVNPRKKKYISVGDYEKIAENYRQLVLNYDRKRDFRMAEQFHIGEMEMLRKRSGAGASSALRRWLGSTLNGYAIYRLLSHYGTSYWHALLMLIVMLACFSWIFVFTGFQTANGGATEPAKVIAENPKPDGRIEYDWGGSTPICDWMADYGKSLVLTLSILTFQRQHFYAPLGALSQLWLIIAALMLTAQVALVLLAIRRRFKR